MMTMMTAMTTVILMIAMLMAIVLTTMTMEGRMFEKVMTFITFPEVFTNKVFSIHKNIKQNSKDIFMKESEDVEVEEEGKVPSFDSLSLLNNNELPQTTKRSWWWFTKDVLRRTTEEGTQLEEEDVDEEGAEAEAERRNRNRGIKVKVRRGSLVEERDREEPTQEKLYPKTRAPTYTRFTSFLCVL